MPMRPYGSGEPGNPPRRWPAGSGQANSGTAAHSTTWEPDTVVYPFEDRPQHIMDTIRPLSWSSVPLALRITFPDATSHALRKNSSLLRMGVLPIPRSRAAKLSIASGATPVLTPAAPLPGFCP